MFSKQRQLAALAITLGLALSPLPAYTQQDHSGHGGNDQSAHDHSGQNQSMQHDGGNASSGMQHGGNGQGGGMMRGRRGGMGGMGGMRGGQQQTAATSGQSTMDVISQVIQKLQADPNTDWSRINIEALRQHLVDMDRVALYADADASDIEGGTEFRVTGPDERTVAAIKRMVPAHALQIERELGWKIATEQTRDGIDLRVTTPEAEVAMIRAIGFVGFMTLGQHHEDHHLMMAGGQPASGGQGQGGGNQQGHSGH